MTLYWRGTSYRAPLSAKTGSDGRYTLAAPAGNYALEIMPTRQSGLFYLLREITVQASISDLDGALAPGYLITGRITDAATGQPVPASHVDGRPGVHHVEPGGSQASTSVGNQSWGFLDANGNYAVWVPAGTYKLYVFAFEGWLGTDRTVTVGNASLTGVDFALQRR